MRRFPHPTASPRRRSGRAGSAAFGVGVLLAALSVLLTVRTPYPTGLGVMFGLALLYLAAGYALVIGLVQLRAGTVDPDGGPTGLAWVCLLRDHRFDHVRALPEAAEHWRCRRCGKRRYTEPRSAGETLNATRVDMMWIRRGDEPEDRR